MVRFAFKSELFPLKPTEGIGSPGMLPRVAEVSDRSHFKIRISRHNISKSYVRSFVKTPI